MHGYTPPLRIRIRAAQHHTLDRRLNAHLIDEPFDRVLELLGILAALRSDPAEII